jgi:phospholipase/carboxylesterase
MVARWGSEHPATPLVVALHGNGTSEHSLIEISPWLPHGPVAYVSVRAPIEHGTGYVWFPGGGRPDATDLAGTCRWFLRWLDTEGDPERPVLLLGFRDGVTLAGGLMLEAPERFAGAALLYGALPFDAGVPMAHAALRGMPVFLAHGTDDTRTPAPLLAQTWDWLARHSGAPVWRERAPGGDQLAGQVVGHLGTWLGDRLDYVRAHGENPLPDGDEPLWPGRLRARDGEPPEVTAGIPQHQSSQIAPAALQDDLWKRLSALDGVGTGPTSVGVAGTRALFLDRGVAGGPDAAYLLPADGEFAHVHPEGDGSLHLVLPDALAYDALAKGWAIAHPLAGVRLGAGTVLVPGPRKPAEVEIVASIVAASHRYASG